MGTRAEPGSVMDVAQLLARLREGDLTSQRELLSIIIPVMNTVLGEWAVGVEYDAVELLDRLLSRLNAESADVRKQGGASALKEWVKRTCIHYLLDRRSQTEGGAAARATPGGRLPPDSSLDEDDSESKIATCVGVVGEFRKIHPFVISLLPQGRAVDLGAVYLLEVRRLLYLDLRRHGKEGTVELCEALVPWDRDDRIRRCGPSWPPIGRLWEALLEPMRRGVVLNVDLVLRCAKSLDPRCDGNANQYYNWVRQIRRRVLSSGLDGQRRSSVEGKAWERWKSVFRLPD